MTEAAGLITAAAGALTGLLYIIGRVNVFGRKLDALNRLAGKELAHNHGSSIKDDVHGIALAVNELHQKHDRTRLQVEQLRRDLDHHVSTSRRRRFLL